MKCDKCNNQLKQRKIYLGMIGPECTKMYGEESYCAYCEWKGDAGAGQTLKELIKEIP